MDLARAGMPVKAKTNGGFHLPETRVSEQKHVQHRAGARAQWVEN
jgi:hypothetical protein